MADGSEFPAAFGGVGVGTAQGEVGQRVTVDQGRNTVWEGGVAPAASRAAGSAAKRQVPGLGLLGHVRVDVDGGHLTGVYESPRKANLRVMRVHAS